MPGNSGGQTKAEQDERLKVLRIVLGAFALAALLFIILMGRLVWIEIIAAPATEQDVAGVYQFNQGSGIETLTMNLNGTFHIEYTLDGTVVMSNDGEWSLLAFKDTYSLVDFERFPYAYLDPDERKNREVGEMVPYIAPGFFGGWQIVVDPDLGLAYTKR